MRRLQSGGARRESCRSFLRRSYGRRGARGHQVLGIGSRWTGGDDPGLLNLRHGVFRGILRQRNELGILLRHRRRLFPLHHSRRQWRRRCRCHSHRRWALRNCRRVTHWPVSSLLQGTYSRRQDLCNCFHWCIRLFGRIQSRPLHCCLCRRLFSGWWCGGFRCRHRRL